MTDIEDKIGSRGVWWFTEGMDVQAAGEFARRSEGRGSPDFDALEALAP